MVSEAKMTHNEENSCAEKRVENRKKKSVPLFQDLGLGKERLEVEDWFGVLSFTANGIIVKLATDHSALLTLAGSGHVSVKKNLPGSLSAAIVTHDDRDYVLSVERSGHEVSLLELLKVYINVSTTANMMMSLFVTIVTHDDKYHINWA